MKIVAPKYYREFHCIASTCPDSCCHGWAVDIDDETVQRYLAMPGALGDKLRRHLKQEEWGWVLALEENGRCPMWRRDGLCRIHAQMGEAALSHVCKTFPRLRHDYGSFQELGLELSCPEAARLILSSDCYSLEEEYATGEEIPEYDREAMAALLRTRRELLDFIGSKALPIRETLAVTLLYGYEVQEELDGGEKAILDGHACLSALKDFSESGDWDTLLAFFKALEILTPAWAERLNGPISQEMPEGLRPLLGYFLSRYYLQAVSDYDIVCRVKLAVVSCLVIGALGGNLPETAQQYSKEIENDPDNVEALLDGAYTAAGLTDKNLIGLLLNKK